MQLQKADAEMAYELQAAKTKQRIKDEQMMIKVVERSQEILVQEQEIQRRERELGELCTVLLGYYDIFPIRKKAPISG